MFQGLIFAVNGQPCDFISKPPSHIFDGLMFVLNTKINVGAFIMNFELIQNFSLPLFVLTLNIFVSLENKSKLLSR